jgi:uncharacterized protein YdeI (YjbR/CyaY-like superfamily)
MTKSESNPKVDFYFAKAKMWKEEFELLRTIVLDCGLVEELKWGCPCYTYQKTNITLIHGFKEYCALLFMKGAVLKDAKNILVQQTENVQAARQIRFSSVKEIMKLKAILKDYIKEAIEAEKAGLKIVLKNTEAFKMPEEFHKVLDDVSGLKTAFYNLTPGRQRGYLLYFSSAKQAKTREARIEKCLPQIFNGQGLEE